MKVGPAGKVAVVGLVIGAVVAFTPMGMVLGRITVDTPPYVKVAVSEFEKNAQFEVRKYAPMVLASVEMKDNDDSSAFRTLAAYIGVFGEPKNRKKESVAMTAPVTTTTSTKAEQQSGEAMAMTAPVVFSGGDRDVRESGKDKEGAGEAMAMTAPVVFSGGDRADGQGTETKNTPQPTFMSFVLPAKYTLETAPTPMDERVTLSLQPERVVAVSRFAGSADAELQQQKAAELVERATHAGMKVIGAWSCAMYNPPFTLPPLRTNEIHLPVALPPETET
mmetsp:Transcript_5526/g.11640  ORF Transcript_5526/g.11640 Transcript_5526/m.11640 type:complete len:278 (+) Transcript_5526:167-1000(+)